MDRLITIATFPNITDAYLFKGRLEEDGLEVFDITTKESILYDIERNYCKCIFIDNKYFAKKSGTLWDAFLRKAGITCIPTGH